MRMSSLNVYFGILLVEASRRNIKVANETNKMDKEPPAASDRTDEEYEQGYRQIPESAALGESQVVIAAQMLAEEPWLGKDTKLSRIRGLQTPTMGARGSKDPRLR